MKYLLLLSLLLICFFAFSPGQFTPAFIVNHDKEAHGIAFFFLSLMVHRSFPAMRLHQIVTLLYLLALAIETIQFLFASRGFSIKDMVYNTIGIIIYFTLMRCSEWFGSLIRDN